METAEDLMTRGPGNRIYCCSIAQLCPTLRLHGLQPAMLPSPSACPRVCSNSCPLSRWYHPTISSSVVPFFSCLHSFPASGSFHWIGSLHQVAKVLELQHQSFQWVFRIDFLAVGGTQDKLQPLCVHSFASRSQGRWQIRGPDERVHEQWGVSAEPWA